MFEDNLYLQGYEFIAGVDEVGRGAIAGPLVAAAVILKRNYFFIKKINDSKKLTEKDRESIFVEILNKCICYNISKISSKKIDKISLGIANKLVFEKAINQLSKKPDIVISDAINFNCVLPVIPLVNGDELSISVAAASIIAKVTRDRIMKKFDLIYPGYNFKENKGYATKEHLQAISEKGVTPIHRLSFKNVLNLQEKIF
jgi:ribonuclease HII